MEAASETVRNESATKAIQQVVSFIEYHPCRMIEHGVEGEELCRSEVKKVEITH